MSAPAPVVRPPALAPQHSVAPAPPAALDRMAARAGSVLRHGELEYRRVLRDLSVAPGANLSPFPVPGAPQAPAPAPIPAPTPDLARPTPAAPSTASTQRGGASTSTAKTTVTPANDSVPAESPADVMMGRESWCQTPQAPAATPATKSDLGQLPNTASTSSVMTEYIDGPDGARRWQVLSFSLERPKGEGFGIALVDDETPPDGCKGHHAVVEGFHTQLAYQAGLRLGDRLHRVNNESLVGLDLQALSDKLATLHSDECAQTVTMQVAREVAVPPLLKTFDAAASSAASSVPAS